MSKTPSTKENLEYIQPFLSKSQHTILKSLAKGEEKAVFIAKIREMADTIRLMPKTYDQDGMGDQAKAYLHYFTGGSNWYITEKDAEDGIDQAFGYACLNCDTENAELGYLSIRELAGCNVEMDFYFTPITLAEVKEAMAWVVANFLLLKSDWTHFRFRKKWRLSGSYPISKRKYQQIKILPINI